MRLSEVRWGECGERVVFVHGSLGAGEAAFGEQRPLAGDWQCHIIFRRGYGDSPAREAVEVSQDADDLIELLGNGAHLVGTSMGGVVSMMAAGRKPEAVRSLTVIEPPAFPIAGDVAEVKAVGDAMKRHWANADPADLKGFVAGFLKALNLSMPLPDPLPPPFLQAARNLTTERPWRLDVPVGAIADAPFPKLVVTGGWSPAFDGISKRLAGLFDAEFHVMEGAGHAVQKLGAPFNQVLNGFMRRADAAA